MATYSYLTWSRRTEISLSNYKLSIFALTKHRFEVALKIGVIFFCRKGEGSPCMLVLSLLKAVLNLALRDKSSLRSMRGLTAL